LVRVILTLSLLLFSVFAQATLGEKVQSVETVRKNVRGVLRAPVVASAFTVHEITTSTLSLKEYAGPDGTIFAVTWQGFMHPDLTSLLGAYFSDFSDAHLRQTRTPGRKPSSNVQGSRVIVEKSGHMRAVQGKAYVPQLFPEGVSVDEIQ
jgi:hypothetical protein